MSPTPPLTQFIGRTERTLRALMDLVLADTGGTFHQWVALNFTALNGDSIDSSELIARLAAALQIDETAAEATIAEMADEQLLQIGSESVVALNDAGRERHARIRAAIDQITAPLYGDLPPGDLAVTRRILSTISDRADSVLAAGVTPTALTHTGTRSPSKGVDVKTSPDIPISSLRADLNGRVIAPDDPGYDDARGVFFTGFDRRPAAVVRVADASDVSRVVNLARETGAELAVRSGGHSRAGHGTTEGGIVLDLSEMNAVEIDAEGRTAWAQPGVKAGDYTKATGAYGLATGLGDTPTVGVGGITLGGGIGFLVRKHGLTIDDVLGAEVVTADGELLRVDEETHADLFWALRGGGGNFGVVTRLRFRLHEIDEVVGGMLLLPASAEVITGLVAAAEAAPEELSMIANITKAPPVPFVPAERHGKPVVMALMVFAGDADAGERAIAPIRALATPLADMVRPIRYPEIYEGPEGKGPGFDAGTNMLVDAFAPGAAEAILEHLETSTAQRAAAQLRVLGGAMARVPDGATAFGHRGAKMMVNVAAMYESPDEGPEHEAWVGSLATALSDGTSAAYVGFLGDAGDQGVRRAYPPATLERLAEVKRHYDPDNLFRLNLNVPPAVK